MEELKAFKEKIDSEISAYLDEAIAEIGKRDLFLAESLSYVKKFILSGGKRLRGALMYYGYAAAGGKDTERMLKTCVSIELIHAFLLIHDDIMDRDEKRHGVMTVHKKYTSFARRYFQTDDSEHFGFSIGICIGDMVAALGSQRIFTSGFPADRVILALDRLQSIVSFTVVGQMRDVYMEYSRRATEKDVLSMYENKTAKYTIEGPLYLGGILAGADEDILGCFTRYAVPLGIAYQIQDDLLGMFGNERKLGKPVGSDLEEGKMTLLVVKALEAANKDDRMFLKSVLGKKGVTRQEVDRAKKIIEETGSRKYAEDLAKRSIVMGKEAFVGIRFQDEEAKRFLADIADYLTNRRI